MSLKKKTIFAFIWSAVNKASSEGVKFIVILILANLLAPSAFGIIALVSVYISVLTILIEQGFSVVLIQEENLTKSKINTVFVFNAITSLILFFIGLNTFELIASFFENDNIAPFLYYANFIILIAPFKTISFALIRKEMEFKQLAIATMISSLIGGGVAIYMAYEGYGAWSLLVKLFIDNILATLFLFFKTSWRPRIMFSITDFKHLYKSSFSMFGIHILKLTGNKLLNVLIGKFMGLGDLGYFEIASKLYSSLNSILGNVMSAVALPLFAKLKSSQHQMGKTYNKLLKVSFLIPIPLYVIVIIICDPLIRLLFDAQWIPVIGLAQILCLVGIVQQLQSLNEGLLYANGKFKVKLIQEVLKITSISLLFYFLSDLGLKIVPYILLITVLFTYCYDLIITSQIIKISILKQFYSIRRTLIVTALAILFSYLLYFTLVKLDLNEVLKVILIPLSYFIIAGLFLIKLDKETKNELLQLIKR